MNTRINYEFKNNDIDHQLKIIRKYEKQLQESKRHNDCNVIYRECSDNSAYIILHYCPHNFTIEFQYTLDDKHVYLTHDSYELIRDHYTNKVPDSFANSIMYDMVSYLSNSNVKYQTLDEAMEFIHIVVSIVAMNK